MNDKQAMRRQLLVKPALLTILKDVIFTWLIVVIHHIRLGRLAQSRQIVHISRYSQHLRLHPSAHPTLVCVIANGTIAVASIRTIVHNIPQVHAKTIATRRVVYIRQTQTMAELMASRAYTSHILTAVVVQFGSTSIGIYLNLIESETIAGSLQSPFMRPNGIREQCRT